MATRRFALQQFGGPFGGSINDFGAKYSTSDRAVIDAVLAAFETHTHPGGTRVADPLAAPAAVLSTIGGQLASNQTLYYTVSFLDRFGLETAASTEVTVATPAPVLAPNLPVLSGSTTPATLTPGLYLYALTSITASGAESQLGPVANISIVPGGDPSVLIDPFPPLPDGATRFAIWRQSPYASAPTRLTTVNPVADPTWTDTGAIPDNPQAGMPGHTAPTSNTTNSSNTITITCPDAGLVSSAGSGITGWRLYRTDSSGNYTGASLIAEIVGHNTDENGQDAGLMTVFVDDGTAIPVQGIPLARSQTLTPTAPVLRTVATLPSPLAPTPQGVLYLVNDPFTGDFSLHLTDGTAWHTVGGSAGVFAPSSRLVTRTSLTPAATGTALVVPADPVVDTAGNDAWVLPFMDSARLQLATAGSWSAHLAVTWPVTDPGDTLAVTLTALLPSGATEIVPVTGAQVTAVTGQTALATFCALPTRHYPGGTLLDVAVTAWYTATTPAMIDITTTVALVAGTAAGAIRATPTNLVAVRSDASAVITFTNAPGASRHEIRVYDPLGVQVALLAAASSGDHVTGLTNGTEYTVQAYAVYDAGAYSPPAVTTVTPTPPTVPDAPRTPMASGANTAATVTFSPPLYDGGSPITGYTVTSNPGGIVVSGAGSPIMVTGLTNGTTYTFTVVATNAIGDSTPSVATDPIMPATG